MKHALIDTNGVVQNIIVYDGVSPYNPAPLILEQVADHINIGDHKDAPPPTPEVE